MRELAERDPTRQGEIVRTVTKSVVVYTTNKRSRLHVTYAFGRPVAKIEADAWTGGSNLSK
jgi:hypothetical protein